MDAQSVASHRLLYSRTRTRAGSHHTLRGHTTRPPDTQPALYTLCIHAERRAESILRYRSAHHLSHPPTPPPTLAPNLAKSRTIPIVAHAFALSTKTPPRPPPLYCRDGAGASVDCSSSPSAALRRHSRRFTSGAPPASCHSVLRAATLSLRIERIRVRTEGCIGRRVYVGFADDATRLLHAGRGLHRGHSDRRQHAACCPRIRSRLGLV